MYNYYGYSLIDLNRSPEEVDKGIALVDKALALEKGKAPKQEGDIDTMFKDLDTSDMYGDDSFNDDELDLDGYQDLEDIESGGY